MVFFLLLLFVSFRHVQIIIVGAAMIQKHAVLVRAKSEYGKKMKEELWKRFLALLAKEREYAENVFINRIFEKIKPLAKLG